MSQAVLQSIDSVFADRQTGVAKDLKLNIRRLYEDSTLTPEELHLATIALARATGFKELLDSARAGAGELGISPEIQQDAEENAAIMGMLNIYYRMRHFVEENSPTAKEEYGAAKLRMTSLANPPMGKEKFEMLAFAVSCINGCERCVSSHEQALIAIGVGRDKLHDLGRLAAVIKGLQQLTHLR